MGSRPVPCPSSYTLCEGVIPYINFYLAFERLMKDTDAAENLLSLVECRTKRYTCIPFFRYTVRSLPSLLCFSTSVRMIP